MVKAIHVLEAFDVVTDHWSPKVIGRVNDQYIKLVKARGQLMWHKHDEEDEMFYIVRGTLRMQFHDLPEVVLHPGEFCVVPRGMMHNPIADEECWMMVIETVSTKHTGDLLTDRTRSIEEQLA